MLLDKTNPTCGLAPLEPVKLSNTLIVLPVAVDIEKTVPFSFVPPLYVVPYKMLLYKINPAPGLAPLVLMKLSNAVIVSPSIGIENTVPFPSTPPLYVVPYNFVLSDDKINPATGLAPLRTSKLANNIIEPSPPAIDMEKTVPSVLPICEPPLFVVPYKMPLYKTNPAVGLAPLVPVKLSNTVIVLVFLFIE